MPLSETIDGRVVDAARRRPHQVAVRDAHGELDYAELVARATSTSRALAQSGIGPGDLVGITVSRCRDTLIGMLAIMMRGAAYVPLEPTLPPARLATIVRRAGLTLCLVPDPDDAPELDLPTLDIEPIGTDDTPASEIGRLAYVIFTSGSTGEPKGVQVPHPAVLNLLDHMAREPGLAPGQVMLGVTTPAFDLAVPDLFLPLTVGATLVLAPRETGMDGAALRRLVERERPHLMQATPTTWRLLLAAGWTGSAQLRAVCGGEAYEAGLARDVAGRVDQLWNFYGPTETTVWSVAQRLGPDTTDPVPMGFPITATSCTVLGADGADAEPGETGELLIGGAGVAAGYLGDEHPAFAPDASGAPRFRTGDFVRQDADGRLTFVERRDGQVKIRGFRVELGDVETALRACPGVAQAVAVAADNPAPHIVAFVVGTDPHTTDLRPADVVGAVAANVPQYMVPSRVEVLPCFPPHANGKVDRRRLRQDADTAAAGVPGAVDSAGPGEDVEVGSPVEQLLAGIWTDVLGLDVRGRHDDFFALGGDSLAATRIAARVAEDFGLTIGVADVFEAPTVAALTDVLIAAMVDEDVASR